MVAGRPRKYHRPETISGRIPGTKKDILDILGISPTQVINTGINVTLENIMHRGRVPVEILDIYIDSLQQNIAELEEKINRAEKIRDEMLAQTKKNEEQITVYDIETMEKTVIKKSEYKKEKHAMIAAEDLR